MKAKKRKELISNMVCATVIDYFRCLLPVADCDIFVLQFDRMEL